VIELFERWYQKAAIVFLSMTLSLYVLGCIAAKRPLGPRGFDDFVRYVLQYHVEGKEAMHGRNKADHR
jgi:hypothetical protein